MRSVIGSGKNALFQEGRVSICRIHDMNICVRTSFRLFELIREAAAILRLVSLVPFCWLGRNESGLTLAGTTQQR